MDLITRPYSLRDLILYFFKLGATGFGGPIALVAAMQRDLVDERNIFSQETFKEGMALSQMAPGPLATQLAIYLGWAHSRILGATLVGVAFVLPSFVMVVALAIFYIRYGEISIIQKLFHGISPAVIAIVCVGAYKLSKKNLGTSWSLWIIAFMNALMVAITKTEIIWPFLVSGFVLMAIKWGNNFKSLAIVPPFFITGIKGPADNSILKSILFFFGKAGSFVFGSGLTIVPFLHGGVVVQHKWLTETQFLDAVAVAMITPGPVVITVGFIGYLVAGLAGATLAAAGTFIPCYLFTIIPAPYFSKFAKNIYLNEFINGITAAAIGAIAGAAFILGKRTIVDGPALIIFMTCLFSLIFAKKVPEPFWILFAGIVGCFL